MRIIMWICDAKVTDMFTCNGLRERLGGTDDKLQWYSEIDETMRTLCRNGCE